MQLLETYDVVWNLIYIANIDFAITHNVYPVPRVLTLQSYITNSYKTKLVFLEILTDKGMVALM